MTTQTNQPEVPEVQPSMFETVSKVVTNSGATVCEVADTSTNVAKGLNTYAKGFAFVAKPHVRTWVYGAMGKEADKVAALKARHPTLKWEDALQGLEL